MRTRRFLELGNNEGTVNIVIWGTGDGYTVYPSENLGSIDFEFDNEIIDYCKTFAPYTEAIIYDIDAENIANAFMNKFNRHEYEMETGNGELCKKYIAHKK